MSQNIFAYFSVPEHSPSFSLFKKKKKLFWLRPKFYKIDFFCFFTVLENNLMLMLVGSLSKFLIARQMALGSHICQLVYPASAGTSKTGSTHVQCVILAAISPQLNDPFLFSFLNFRNIKVEREQRRIQVLARGGGVIYPPPPTRG